MNSTAEARIVQHKAGTAGWTAKGLAVLARESTLTVTRTDVDQAVQQAQTTVSRPAGQTAYSHDLNGNMLGQGEWAFSWTRLDTSLASGITPWQDDENRLVEAVAAGESRLNFDFGVKYSVDAAGSAEKLVWVKCAHVGAQCTCSGAFTQNPGGPNGGGCIAGHLVWLVCRIKQLPCA